MERRRTGAAGRPRRRVQRAVKRATLSSTASTGTFTGSQTISVLAPCTPFNFSTHGNTSHSHALPNSIQSLHHNHDPFGVRRRGRFAAQCQTQPLQPPQSAVSASTMHFSFFFIVYLTDCCFLCKTAGKHLLARCSLTAVNSSSLSLGLLTQTRQKTTARSCTRAVCRLSRALLPRCLVQQLSEGDHQAL